MERGFRAGLESGNKRSTLRPTSRLRYLKSSTLQLDGERIMADVPIELVDDTPLGMFFTGIVWEGDGAHFSVVL